ncbi:hypothetical protein [Aeromonas media]|uniref:hypothetical protein n=1 Tax=Aeromonas media TaxID=651 RepID=UPI00148AF249|nr:hypothetical protein [Aeromonas media]
MESVLDIELGGGPGQLHDPALPVVTLGTAPIDGLEAPAGTGIARRRVLDHRP